MLPLSISGQASATAGGTMGDLFGGGYSVNFGNGNSTSQPSSAANPTSTDMGASNGVATGNSIQDFISNNQTLIIAGGVVLAGLIAFAIYKGQ